MEKNSAYDALPIFSNPFTKNGFRSKLRLKYRFCSCARFNPTKKHKVKWVGIGIVMFVILAIISRIFLSQVNEK